MSCVGAYVGDASVSVLMRTGIDSYGEISGKAA